MGTENFVACKRFGAEGRPPNNSLKVSASIGMVTDERLTMLVVGGFFMFSFSATNTAKVCSKPGVPWWRVLNTCLRRSCDSNCETQKRTVHCLLRIGFFTQRPIPAGAELTFDYKLQCCGKVAQICHCEALNCCGFIGGDKQTPLKNTVERITIAIVLLSPVAVAGNAMILAAVWRKNFARTPFHILRSGLAFTDLCTGVFAQPFYSATFLMCSGNSTVVYDSPTLIRALRTIGEGSGIYFVSATVLILTAMSIERWLIVSRRSFFNRRRACFAVFALILTATPPAVLRVLENVNTVYGRVLRFKLVTVMVSCYPIIMMANVKVYQMTIVFIFLSSSINPALYLWRMNDIRNGLRQHFCSG
ncbi:uncharacterized protein [Pocillopora verrucosa]|uniref:uncharacterized protein n=1 Tax=Pocillopora verrucosa TaxID=203993 RepID=UPI00333E40D6